MDEVICSQVFVPFFNKQIDALGTLCVLHVSLAEESTTLLSSCTNNYYLLNIISINVIAVIYGRYKGRTSFGACNMAFISCCLHKIYTVFLAKLTIKYFFRFTNTLFILSTNKNIRTTF